MIAAATTGTPAAASRSYNGTIIYDPEGQFETLAQGETAHDTFTYTISDNHGATSVATVTVVVHGVNDAPEAHDDHIGGVRYASPGDPDIFFANNGANRVWLNDGAGMFAQTPQSIGPDDSRAVGLADLDGDGDLDAFVGNNKVADRIWLNDGSGHFSDSGQALGGMAKSFGLGLADLDGDGDTDAFVAERAGSQVWLNNGSGVFGSNGQSMLGSSDTRAVALADVDGDGDVDAFVATTGANELWLNDGSGHFSSSGQALGTVESHGVELADLDGDGDADAFVVNASGGSQVWLNDGSGHFTNSGQALGSANGFGVGRRRPGRRRRPRCLCRQRRRQQGVAERRLGPLQRQRPGAGQRHSRGVTLGDVDGDGDLDAIVVNLGTNRSGSTTARGHFSRQRPARSAA